MVCSPAIEKTVRTLSMKQYLALLAIGLSTTVCLAETTPMTEIQPTVTAVQTDTKPFLTMTQEEFNACGLGKITQDERSALQTWVQKYASGAFSKTELSAPIKIQALKDGAKIIELADGRSFSISSTAQKVAALWNVGDFVRIEQGKKKSYYSLTHSASGKSIKVKLLKKETVTETK